MNYTNTSGLLSPHREKGAALIIGLVLLMALTIIGVSVLSTTSLEQRMAGNMSDLNLAFNSAETASRVFSQHVNKQIGPLEIICVDLKAACISEELEPDWWVNANKNWWNNNAIDLGTTLFGTTLKESFSNLAEQPKIVIQHQFKKSIKTGVDYQPIGNHLITLTTRGIGMSKDTEVITQQVIFKQ